MDNQLKLQLSYFLKAIVEIEKSLKIFHWANKSNPIEFNNNYPFCMIPFDYLDKFGNPKEEYLELELVVLLPIFYGENNCKRKSSIDLRQLIDYSEKSIQWLSKQITNLKSYNSPQRNELLEIMNLPSKSPSISGLRKPKRGELKKNCEEIASSLGFEKETELTNADIDLVCRELEKRGIQPNPKSVGSTLRDKLGYRKYNI